MKNIEKYMDEIIEKQLDSCDLTKRYIMKPIDCFDTGCEECFAKTLRWLNEEYIPQIDWSKVPVDTPVITAVGNRHFCKYEKDHVFTFDNGTTSWTYRSEYGWTTRWDKTTVQLARPEDIEKYSI